MTLRRRARKAEGRSEDGVTVIEVMIVTALLSLVMAVFMGSLVTVQNNMVVQQRRSRNNDLARQALFSLDREIRSGNLVYDPAAEPTPYYSLVVHTQANAPTRTPPNRCVEWRVETNKQLRQRWWDPANPAGASGWTTVATDIFNRQENVPAFTIATTGQSAVVDIVLLPNVADSTAPPENARLSSSVAARNTVAGSTCSPRPAG